MIVLSRARRNLMDYIGSHFAAWGWVVQPAANSNKVFFGSRENAELKIKFQFALHDSNAAFLTLR
jgi:hypothetical protein